MCWKMELGPFTESVRKQILAHYKRMRDLSGIYYVQTTFVVFSHWVILSLICLILNTHLVHSV